MKTYGMWVIGLAAAVLTTALLVAAAPAPAWADKIRVAPPPPPPPAENKPAPTFDYSHEIKKVARNRKPVVALLRPGDVVELADYLPFGRGVGITETNPDGTKSQTLIKSGREDKPALLPSPFLARELLKTGEFVVIERERILEIARELALAKTKAVDPATAPRPGRLVGVHYIIEAAYYPVGALPADDPALIPVKRQIAKRRLAVDPSAACVMYLTVYKVETGEVKAVACGADLQPLVAVQRAVQDLVDQMGNIVEPIKVAAVNPETGMATLDIGSESGVKAGDVFTVAPPAGAEKAAAPVKVEVTQAEGLLSSAKVVAGDKAAVRAGQEVKPEVKAPPPETRPPATK
jgi:hypothetical protein